MRILIATGGSPHSLIAVRLGGHIARAAQTSPTLLTVIRQPAEQARADEILAQATELLATGLPEPVAADTLVRVGRPADVIVAVAVAGKYDLIILGERSGHKLVTRLLGSTAERVIEHAPCPVMIAKGKGNPIHRILLCDSGAATSSVLDRFTAGLAELRPVELDITVLHVMSQISAAPGINGHQLRAEAQELIQEHAPEGELLERDLRMLTRVNVQPQAKVRHGLVVDEILAEAQSGDYDLVVIGAHRVGRWQRWLLDDLAHEIITHVDRPVLVV